MGDWPDHFPESCPPADAADATGSFYRLVAGDPPTPGDFENHLQLRAAGTINPKRVFPDDCMAAGLSILSEKQDAEGLRESVGPLRSKLIAYGEITGHGVFKATPSRFKSHHTWWLPGDTDPHPNFAVVT